MNALKTINRRIDEGLYRRGFQLAQVRELLCLQFWVALFLPLVGLIFGVFFVRDCFLATMLATVNFYFLARLIQNLIFVRKGAVAILLLSFYLRLAVLACIVVALIVWLDASVVALLVGLSSVVLSISLWGGMTFLRKHIRRQKDGC